MSSESPPTRRRFLAATAGAAALAGCLGGRSGRTGTRSTETSLDTGAETETATPAAVGATRTVDGTPVAVESMAIQSSMLRLATADSMTVAESDGWFVLARVRPDGEGPPLDAFSLVVDGDAHEPVTNRGAAIGYGSHRDGGPYRPDEGGWTTFDVSVGTVESARLVCGDAAWRVPGSVRGKVGRPRPSWDLGSWSVPGELSPGEPFTVGGSVENAGEVAATFRGALNVANLNYAYYPYTFGVALGPGESGRWSVELTAPSEVGRQRDVDFHLRTAAGGATKTATLRPTE
jgi:hypothetical protein